MSSNTFTKSSKQNSIQTFQFSPEEYQPHNLSFETILRTLFDQGKPIKAQRYYYLHIQKAAGNYLSNLLCSHFPWVHIRRYDGMLGFPLPQLKEIAFVHGHFGLGDSVFTSMNTPSICVTMLRHPVERMISTYQFRARLGGGRFQHQIRSGAMGVVEFAEKVSILEGFQYSYFGLTPQQAMHDPQTCLNNLINHVSLFGFTHEMANFLITISLLLGFHKMFDPYKANATQDTSISASPETIPVTNSELQDLHHILAVDIEFYQSALAIYQKRTQTLEKLVGQETFTHARKQFHHIIQEQRKYVDLLGIAGSMPSRASL